MTDLCCLALIFITGLVGCITACPLYMVEFCGSDGKTYTSNPCFVKAQMQSQGINGYENFKMDHFGPCSPKGVTAFPEKRQEQEKKHCVMGCPMYLVTFCGSDGKTYNQTNPCFVSSRMCSQGVSGYENFKMAHYGPC